jgi:hypothetical protein
LIRELSPCIKTISKVEDKYGATTEGEDFLLFKIGDATVYSRVFNQLLLEAKTITSYGRDMARMLVQVQDFGIDFAPDFPTKQVIVDDDADRKRIREDQEQALFNVKTKKTADRCETNLSCVLKPEFHHQSQMPNQDNLLYVNEDRKRKSR